MTMRSRRRLGVALTLGLALPLSACATGPAPLPTDEAVTHYEDLATELGAALAVDGTSWQHEQDTRTVTAQDEACLFTPGTWGPENALPEPNDEESWDARIMTVNSVLGGYGFEQIDDVTEQESRTVLMTQDEHGATLRITAEGEIQVQDATVDADPCTAETLGTD